MKHFSLQVVPSKVTVLFRSGAWAVFALPESYCEELLQQFGLCQQDPSKGRHYMLEVEVGSAKAQVLRLDLTEVAMIHRFGEGNDGSRA